MTFLSKENKHAQKGATLLELLLYMGIFSILTVALFQLFSSILSTQLESQSTSSVLSDGQFILNRLNYDARKTQGIASPPHGSPSGTLQLNIDGEVYIYSVAGGNLVVSSQTEGSQQLNSVGTSVADLNFLRLSDNNSEGVETITASFTLHSTVLRQGESQIENFKTTIGVRPKE